MNNKEKVWKIGMWVGVLLAIFLAVISIKQLKSIAYVGKDTPIMNSISVNGKGEEVAIPDIATFTFGITETNKEVSVAQEKATKKFNAALAAIKEAGIEEKDIKTTSYSINPHYEYEQGICTALRCMPGKNVLTGYDVSQNVEVKVRDIKKVGSIFTTIGSLDVDNVNSIQFSVDELEKVKAKARTKAIADAQNKADELAKQLGVKLVRITGYYDMTDDYSYYGRGGDMMMSAVKNEAAAPVAPQIPAGEQKIEARVSITYEIR